MWCGFLSPLPTCKCTLLVSSLLVINRSMAPYVYLLLACIDSLRLGALGGGRGDVSLTSPPLETSHMIAVIIRPQLYGWRPLMDQWVVRPSWAPCIWACTLVQWEFLFAFVFVSFRGFSHLLSSPFGAGGHLTLRLSMCQVVGRPCLVVSSSNASCNGSLPNFIDMF